MNAHGAYLTFLTFLLILSIITLMEIASVAKTSAQETNETNLYFNTSETFGNIEKNIIEFDKNGYSKAMEQKIIPFNYSTDSNRLWLSQTLPLSTKSIEVLFNEINYFRSFLKDNNFLDDSLAIDFNGAKNKPWGGDKNKLSFLLNPFCMELKIVEDTASKTYNSFDFNAASNSSKCDAPYNDANVLGFDVNVTISSKQWNEDYNSVSYSVNIGVSKISFRLDANTFCSNCKVPSGQLSYDGTFDPTKGNSIVITCNPAPCQTSKPIIIKFGQGIKIDSNTTIELKVATEFKGAIDGFEIMDINAAVSNKEGKNRRANN